MITKEEWVEAINETIEKYKNNTFDGTYTKCSFCCLIKTKENSKYMHCEKCIQLDINLVNSSNFLSKCVNMMTYPSSFNHRSKSASYILRIKFWEIAIERINEMKDFDMDEVRNMLWLLDKELTD